MIRALIDAEFHDTPIGRCVVVGRCDICSGPAGPPEAQPRCEGCPTFSAGDVLAVVETCPTCEGRGWDVIRPIPGVNEDDVRCPECSGTGHVRRGFVRVVETLPVVDRPSGPEPSDGPIVYAFGSCMWAWWSANRYHAVRLPASPGDVVLVTEPWCEIYSKPSSGCECAFPWPVTLIHRDGVLGEVEA